MQKSLFKEMKTKNHSSCHCCPYGFHIDRDFVQYCESIYNCAQLDKRKQEKRDHRRKHKSVESYLGLEIPASKKCSFMAKPVTDGEIKQVENEALNSLDGVMKDFENTWLESSARKSEFINSKGVHFKVKHPAKESSACFAIKDTEKPPTEQKIITINKHSQGKGSPKAVVLSREMLAKIREQISVSLKRTKELEAQVKSIPHLQVKLMVLDKERQSLLNKLNDINKESSQIISRESKHVNWLNSNSFECKSVQTYDSNQHQFMPEIGVSNSTQILEGKCNFSGSLSLNEEQLNRNMKNFKKDVGTSCTVLTRDIGVGHVQNKLVSTGVGKKNIFSPSFHFQSMNDNLNLNKSESSDSIDSGSEMEKVSDSSRNASNFRDTPFEYRNKVADEDEKKISHLGLDSAVEKYEKSVKSSVVDESPAVKKENMETITDLQMSDLIIYEKWLLDKQNTLSNKISTAVQASDKYSVSTDFIPLRGSYVTPFTVSEVADCIRINDGDNSSHETLNISENVEKEKHTLLPFKSQKSQNLKILETVGVGDINVNDFICFCCADKAHARALTNSLRMRSVGTNTVECQLDTHTDKNNAYESMLKYDGSIQYSVSHDVTGKSTKISNNFTTKIVEVRKTTPSDNSQNLLDKNTEKIPDLHIISSDSECESTSTTVEAFLSEDAIKNSSDIMGSSTDLIIGTEKIITDSNGQTEDDLQLQWDALEKSDERITLSKEVKAACKVLNDYLLKSDGEFIEEKASNSLSIIQTEWFRVANQKNADPIVIEEYLDAFEEFSDKLLYHIVNLADSNGNTAIHYAVSYSNFDVVSIIIDSKVCDVNKRNKAGYTCIMLVALAEMLNETHYLVVQRLFHMGDINVKASQNGQTALMLAVSHGKLEVVRMLLDAGAEANLQDNDGSTALMCASEHGHIDIVRLLLSHPDCDSTIVDNDGSNALTIAMEAGNKDIGLLIYANMNFSKGNSPHAVAKQRIRSAPRAKTPTLQSMRPSSPSARSTCSLPSAFHLS